MRRSNWKRTEIMLTILISAALTCMQLQAISHFEPAKLRAPHVFVPWKLLTGNLPHLSCVTRITMFCLVNVAAFMIILQLFEYLTLNIIIFAFSVIFCHSKKLYDSKIYSKSGSIFLFKVTYIANLEFLRIKQISGYYFAHHEWYST